MTALVKNFITENDCVLHPETSLADAIPLLAERQTEIAPVINENGYFYGVFMVTSAILSKISFHERIGNWMHSDLLAISPEHFITDIHARDFRVPVIPVVKNGKFKGFITYETYVEYQLNFYKNMIDQLRSQIHFLQQNDKELEEIMNHSYDGFAITNREGITIKVNKAWDRLTGLKREEVIGVPLDKLVKKGFFSDSVTMKVLESRKPTTIIQRMKSGKQAMMTGSPIFDEHGELDQVIINIRDVTELYQLKESLERKEKLAERYQTEISQIRLKQTAEEDIVAESKTMRDVLDLASRIARVESTVLLTGESGAGKGVIARYIHTCSLRGADQPFIIVNCGAIPQELLESELFGYVGGAFTGANRTGKPGMFELAEGGTLFLDEIAELPLKLQVKLLHVIQEKELTRVGGTKPVKLNVRIISATNKHLPELIESGKFREDLFYRLNVVPLSIPPLRSRKEDILPLAAHYLNIYNKKYSLNKSLSGKLIDTLMAYHWPGNIRELANVIERMVVTSRSDVLTPEDFPFTPHRNSNVIETGNLLENGRALPPLKEATDRLEFELITKALQTGKTQAKAAEILGVSLSTFLRKMKRLNIHSCQ